MKEKEYQVMDSVIGKEVTAKEVQDLVMELPNQWFLLEVLEMDGKGRAKNVKIIAHNENKDVLREYLLDLDTNDRKYIFFFTDPEKACEL